MYELYLTVTEQQNSHLVVYYFRVFAATLTLNSEWKQQKKLNVEDATPGLGLGLIQSD